MPKPEMGAHDLRTRCRSRSCCSARAIRNIDYVLRFRTSRCSTSFDRRLITQAVTNLVKNATEAVETARDARLQGRRTGRDASRRTCTRDSDRVDHRGHRQRPRPAEAEPRPPARALCHHQGTQGHRPRSRDRAEDHRAARRRAVARRRPAGTRARHGALVRITLPLSTCTAARPPSRTRQPNKPRPTRPDDTTEEH